MPVEKEDNNRIRRTQQTIFETFTQQHIIEKRIKQKQTNTSCVSYKHTKYLKMIYALTRWPCTAVAYILHISGSAEKWKCQGGSQYSF